MKNLGSKIRFERKKKQMTLAQLAKKVGTSPMTLHRIEAGKTSPSITLLSEIATNLNRSVVSFLEEVNPKFIHIKYKNQRVMSAQKLKIKVIGPRNMIAKNIVVAYAELKKGGTIDPHTNPGKEFAFIIEGRCKFEQNNQTILLRAGESLCHDARIEHSVVGLEKTKAFSIFVEDRE
jgi:quercetin dioxygenase-like cupin family protein